MNTTHFRKIDLMIIGAAKGGTTTLSNWLFNMPNIAGHHQMEFDFFIDEEEYNKGFGWALRHYYPNVKQGDIVAGKSAGMMSNPEALLLLRNHNPDCRLLVVLRNPVDRAYSAYWYARLRGWEHTRSFEQAMEREMVKTPDDIDRWYENKQYLNRGKYIRHLEYVRKLFSGEQLQVFLTEDIFEHPGDILRSVYKALGISAPENAGQPNGVKNAASRTRYPWLSDLLTKRIPHPDFIRTPLILGAKKRIKATLRSWTDLPFRPPPMDPGIRAELLDFLNHTTASWSILSGETYPDGVDCARFTV